MAEGGQQRRPRILPVHAARGQAEAAEQRFRRGQQALDPGLHALPVEPAEGGGETAPGFPRLRQAGAHPPDHRLVASLHGQRREGERLALGMRIELLEQRFVSSLAGDGQAIQVRLDALVEFGELFQVVVRRAHGVVAEQGEEGGFLGVLIEHRDDWQAHSRHRFVDH